VRTEMSNTSEGEVEEALREYLRAVDEYHKIVGRYFHGGPVVPGKPIVFGKPMTEAALQEIEEADANVRETQTRWMEALKRAKGL